ncbi:MAG: hypothetical protein R2877_08175 [Bdellovibrionota bacterium]
MRFEKKNTSIGVVCNAVDLLAQLVASKKFRICSQITSAHDPLKGYVPMNMTMQQAIALKPIRKNTKKAGYDDCTCEAHESIDDMSAHTFDYGNNLVWICPGAWNERCIPLPGICSGVHSSDVL